jgi:hypothetical protein
MQKTTIPLSKVKFIFRLAIPIILTIYGYHMVGLEASKIAYGVLFAHGIGYLFIAIGCLGAVEILLKLFDSAPGLVLDECGLTDNRGALSAGLIPWSDITGFEICQVHRRQILYVLLKNPDNYIAKFGPINRALLRANKRTAASPVAITTNALSIGFDELVALVNDYFAASRQGA